MGEARQPGVVDAAEFAIEISGLHVYVGEDATALEYLEVQSRPVRVRSLTCPLSIRAAMRKPSSLISWTHRGRDRGFQPAGKGVEERTVEEATASSRLTIGLP